MSEALELQQAKQTLEQKNSNYAHGNSLRGISHSGEHFWTSAKFSDKRFDKTNHGAGLS